MAPLFVDIRPIENIKDMRQSKTPLRQFGIPSKVYIHRGYNGYMKYNDIAILEFPEYVDFGIEPIKLAKNYVVDYKDTAIAAGYGRYIYNGKILHGTVEKISTLQINKFLTFSYWWSSSE